MTRESVEVFRLEFDDDWLGEVGLEGEGCRLASVVASVSKLFTHKSICIMPVVYLFGDLFISAEISGPSEIRPADTSHCCMHVSRFNSIEVSPVIEKVPFYCSYYVRLPCLGVELGELPSPIGDEYASKTFLHVL